VILEAKTEKLWVEKKRKQSQEQGDGGKNARGEKKTSKGEIVIYRAAYSRVMVMGSKGGWGGKTGKRKLVSPSQIVQRSRAIQGMPAFIVFVIIEHRYDHLMALLARLS